jgi:phosphatidate cytidylyltransferase
MHTLNEVGDSDAFDAVPLRDSHMSDSKANSASAGEATLANAALLRRVATTAVGVPVILAVVFVGGWLLAVAVAVAAVWATWEAVSMLIRRGFEPSLLTSAVLAVAFVAAAALPHPHQWTGFVLIVGGMISAAWFLITDPENQRFLSWSLTLVVAIYVGLLLSQLIEIRSLHNGLARLVLVLVLTWSFDTGAFFAGRLWGRTPFMAHVSRSKTWEGVAGGTFVTIVAGVVGAYLTRLSLPEGVLLSIVVSIAVQAGDLLESSFKRYCDVKDSGSLLPGHGGILDRIDGLLFSGAASYYVLAAGHLH